MNQASRREHPWRSALPGWLTFMGVLIGLSLWFGDGVPWFSLVVATLGMALLTWFIAKHPPREPSD